jgi:hypothetical protein
MPDLKLQIRNGYFRMTFLTLSLSLLKRRRTERNLWRRYFFLTFSCEKRIIKTTSNLPVYLQHNVGKIPSFLKAWSRSASKSKFRSRRLLQWSCRGHFCGFWSRLGSGRICIILAYLDIDPCIPFNLKCKAKLNLFPGAGKERYIQQWDNWHCCM